MPLSHEEMFAGALGSAETDEETLGKKKRKNVAKEVIEEQVEDEPKVEETEQVVAEETQSEEPTKTEEAPEVEEVEQQDEEQEPEPVDEPEEEIEDVEPEEERVINVQQSRDSILQIVQILDLYRAFDDKTELLAEKLFDSKDESEIIALSLRQNLITLDALQAIANVHQAEDVNKAFFLVSLNDDLLQEIGRLITTFTAKEIEFDDHISYCRKLEIELRGMNDEFIEKTNALLDMLRAAQPRD